MFMAVPDGSRRKFYCDAIHSGTIQGTGAKNGKGSVAEAGTDGDTFAASGAAAAQHSSSSLSFHARAEPVRLHAVAAIGLKCALGHENALLFPVKYLCLVGKS
jgi:hypothetical protein